MRDLAAPASTTLADIVAAIPALDEEAALPGALRALARARPPGARLEAVILANNCRDGTARAAREEARRLGLRVMVVEATLPPALASAGRARRIAMEAARTRCAPHGLVLSTDADARLGRGALEAALAAAAQGAEAICGDLVARLPAAMRDHPRARRFAEVETRYRDLAHEVRFRLDLLAGRQRGPERPSYMEAGACLAVSARLLDRLGGLPAAAASEDRLLIRAAEASGARVAYPPGFRAAISTRLDGRAAGGHSEMLRARLSEDDPLADQNLRPASLLRRDWRDGLEAARAGRPPAPFAPAPERLAVSELARDLPELEALVADEVLPGWQAWRAAA